MRTLKDLMEKKQDVWFFVDDDVKADFVNECNQLGYAFDKRSHSEDKTLTVERCTNRMALYHPDKTLWYVAAMIWHYSFERPAGVVSIHTGKGGGPFFRVNYKRFINGEKDYIYNTRDSFWSDC